jgi:hypothetical protein
MELTASPQVWTGRCQAILTAMSKDRGQWQAGRRAWARLNGWHQDSPSATPGHPDDGSGALDALADIGLVRHLLEQAELVAVRTARKHGKSWAEIATKLGVTRQSAWERWRELDDVPASPGERLPISSLDPQQSDLPQAMAIAEVASEISDAARESRRHSTVRVPRVLGLAWDDAVRVLLEHRLVAVGHDPDGPPLPLTASPSGVVSDQSPESGAKVPAGSMVTLWIERGDGSAGVREPRRPKPGPRSARELPPYEVAEEAVG